MVRVALQTQTMRLLLCLQVIDISELGGPIAQRLEQQTHNLLVPGSNPGGPTRTSLVVSALKHSASWMACQQPDSVASEAAGAVRTSAANRPSSERLMCPPKSNRLTCWRSLRCVQLKGSRRR